MAEMKNFGESLSAQFRGLEGRHPGLWPLAPRLLCAVGVLALVTFLGWYLYWSPLFEELEAGVRKEATLRTQYQDKVRQAVNLDALRKQKEEVSGYVATLEKQLPSKAEMDALLSDINQAGLGRGLQFELFRPGQSVVKGYYAELPINIRVTGNYHDVGAFTSDVAHLPRIVTLNNLNLSVMKDGKLSLDTVAKTFRYLDPAEIAEQRKAAAPRNVRGGRK